MAACEDTASAAAPAARKSTEWTVGRRLEAASDIELTNVIIATPLFLLLAECAEDGTICPVFFRKGK
jgi:hypothetical protein